MFSAIKAMLLGDDGGAKSAAGDDPVAAAAAALLVETAMLDGDFDEEERITIRRVLEDSFELTDGEADALVAHAEQSQSVANGTYAAARVIRDSLDEAGRIAVVEMLWQVAYADGELHDYEANLVRRAAGLLYVRDQDSGQARKRALSALGLESAD